MKAALRIEVRDGRVVDLFTEAPLCAKVSPGPPYTLWVVGGAAGLLEGDDLHVDVAVGDGQHLVVRSVASQVAHPSPSELDASFTVNATVGVGASLVWRPEPVILAAGSRYRARAHVDLAEGARVAWCDELVFGRSGECFDDLAFETRLTIDDDGEPALRDGLTSARGWRSTAVVGASRYVGTLVVLGDDGIVDAHWSPLARRGALTRVLDRDPLDGRRVFHSRLAAITQIEN